MENLSQGSRRVLVYILPKHTHYKTIENNHSSSENTVQDILE